MEPETSSHILLTMGTVVISAFLQLWVNTSAKPIFAIDLYWQLLVIIGWEMELIYYASI